MYGVCKSILVYLLPLCRVVVDDVVGVLRCAYKVIPLRSLEGALHWASYGPPGVVHTPKTPRLSHPIWWAIRWSIGLSLPGRAQHTTIYLVPVIHFPDRLWIIEHEFHPTDSATRFLRYPWRYWIDPSMRSKNLRSMAPWLHCCGLIMENFLNHPVSLIPRYRCFSK